MTDHFDLHQRSLEQLAVSSNEPQKTAVRLARVWYIWGGSTVNVDKKRALLGIGLATMFLGMPTVHAASPIKVKGLQKRVTALEATAAAVQAELDSINATISQLQADLDAETTTREAEVSQLGGRITVNESDIVANSALIEDNTNDIADLHNALDLASPVIVKDGGGNLVGSVIGADPSSVFAITQQGYLVQVQLHSGNIFSTGTSFNRYYETSDCSGQAYTNLPNGMPFGLVFTETFNEPLSPLWYVQKKDLPLTSATITAVFSGGNCGTAGPFQWDAARLYPNDPNVTGVQQSPYQPPLVIMKQ